MMHVELLSIFLFCYTAFLTGVIITLSGFSALTSPVGSVNIWAASSFPGRIVFSGTSTGINGPLTITFTATELMIFVSRLIGLAREFFVAMITGYFDAVVVWMTLAHKIFRHPFAIASTVTANILISFRIRLATLNRLAAISTFNNDTIVIMMIYAFLIFFLTNCSTLWTAKMSFVFLGFAWCSVNLLSAYLTLYRYPIAEWMSLWIFFPVFFGAFSTTKLSFIRSVWNDVKISIAIKTVYYGHGLFLVKKMPLSGWRLLFGQSHFTDQGHEKSALCIDCPNVFSITDSLVIVNGI